MDVYPPGLLSPFKTSPEEEARLAEQAKTFPVKKIPYFGERKCLKFDRKTHAVLRCSLSKTLAKGNLSYKDYLNGMHIATRATANEMRLFYTPIFANNDEQLKLALAQQTFSYICASWPGMKKFFGGGSRVPQELVENRELLEKLSIAALNRWRTRPDTSRERYQHIAISDAHGGYLALRASVAYKAWRLAKDSTTIGEEMGIAPQTVRQFLARLCEASRRLGLETFPRHHTCFHETQPFDFDKEEEALKLYTASVKVLEIPIENIVNQLVQFGSVHIIRARYIEPETERAAQTF
jgi:hypothetical protein